MYHMHGHEQIHLKCTPSSYSSMFIIFYRKLKNLLLIKSHAAKLMTLK